MNMLKTSHEELIQAQLQLIQAEKLESVGSLAAGVAHEVKNPLAILLMGLTYLAEGDVRDVAADQEVMRAMREAIHRANLIVRGLVDFSANHQLDAVPQDLNSMIVRSLLLVKHELTVNHVTAVSELDTSLPHVLLDPNKIQQVFVNLFMNAIQAMQPGGTLTVRTYCHQSDEAARDDGPHSGETCGGSGAAVVAEVDDTGTGIPLDKLGKVFEPFFTTKAAGRGTGLGLTVVQKIVELHDGMVSIRNRYKNPSDLSTCIGTRVTITLKAIGSLTHDSDHQRTHS
jgi:signal transduction histidine kinase